MGTLTPRLHHVHPSNKIIHLHMRLTLGDKGHKAKGIPILLWLLIGYQPEPIGTIIRRRCLCPLFQPLDRGGNCIHVENHSQCLWFSFHAEIDNMSA